MRTNISSSLMLLLLVSTAAADIHQEIVEEKKYVTLRCPRPVRGNVTWSREMNGHKHNILTTYGDNTRKYIHDPDKRFNTLADKSLYILKVLVSDAGTYLCNDEPAAELKVIPDIHQEIVEEKMSITLRCPRPVEGYVTWSRKINGQQDPILTTYGQSFTKYIHDPDQQFSALADKSLHISKVLISDTGTYLCNDKPAAELKVIPAGTTVTASEGSFITLRCPHDVGPSHDPTWSRNGFEMKGSRFEVSAVNKSLTIWHLLSPDSGLYNCDGKLAAYLLVITGSTEQKPSRKPRKDKKKTTTISPMLTERPTAAPSSPAATTTTPPTKTEQPTVAPSSPAGKVALGVVVVVVVVLLLFIIIFITFLWRRRLKRQDCENGNHIYNEVEEGVALQRTCGPSNQIDPTYSTISYPPPNNSTKDAFQPNESLYSEICEFPVSRTDPDDNSSSEQKLYYILQRPGTSGVTMPTSEV